MCTILSLPLCSALLQVDIAFNLSSCGRYPNSSSHTHSSKNKTRESRASQVLQCVTQNTHSLVYLQGTTA